MSEKYPTPYADPRWRAIRLEVLERDAWSCHLRLGRCKGRATAVDHLDDWRDGGAWFDPRNLAAACTSCNTAKRNARVAERARAQREAVARNPRPDLTW